MLVFYAVMAAAADWFAPQAFTGHSLVLGLVFYWIALHTLGAHTALAVVGTSGAVLALKWGQPYSGALIVLEGLWVGHRWRRGRNPIIADLFYWTVFGTPVSWFLYTSITPLPSPVREHALLLQPINGLIAIWIAYIVLELAQPAVAERIAARPQQLRGYLLKRYLAFGTFPLLIAAILAARTFEKRALAEARDTLKSTANNVAAEIAREVGYGTELVQRLAVSQAEASWYRNAPRLNAELNAARRERDLFVTMLATDGDGWIIGAANAAAPTGRGRSVADRDYFLIPKLTGQPHITGIFRGRGFGSDLLVAVSAPVRSHSGEFLGVIEGSLKAAHLQDLLATITPDGEWRSLLSDQRQTVIASHDFGYPPLTKLKGTRLEQAIRQGQDEVIRISDQRPQNDVLFLTVTVPVPGTAWHLTLQRTWADALQPVLNAYAAMLLVTFLTALLASLFAAWSIRDLLASWQKLMVFSRSLDPLPLEQDPHERLPEEFRGLIRNLAEMAHRLRSEQEQVEQLLRELESRVRARTSELEVALELAQSADRAKSAFLATVSHELRTPLTSIITGLHLLKVSPQPRSEMELQLLATCEKSSQVLMGVINSVLDYSKLEAGGTNLVWAPLDPAAVARDVADMLTPAARAAKLELRLESRLPAGLSWAGDEQHLRQVLLNLVGNGIKFTASGHVLLTVWLEETPSGRRLHFAVQDTGPGIEPELQARVFEPFFQLATNRVRAHAGTGLGLPICRKLVALMGGELLLRSTPGHGSTFHFWLPETPPAKAVTPAP